MQYRKDIWRCAIVPVPAAEIVARGSLDGLPLHWLPGSGDLRFLADPFGLWRDGRLYVFVEAFDYRSAVGTIDVLVFDAEYRLVERRPALREPWHLSYPFVFEGEGETWLLPEAHRSGRVTLYRSRGFPDRWEPAHELALDRVPLDATPVFHGGLWWLFYAAAEPVRARLTELHAAYAERLAGPWTPHPANPLLVDPDGARPGGTPLVIDGALRLPLQGCRGTYGRSVRMLVVEELGRERWAARVATELVPPASAVPYVDGLHTLSAAGPVTLIDTKRLVGSLKGLALRPLRDVRRIIAQR